MITYAALYWQFFKVRCKVMMEYRADFFIGVLSVLLIQGTSILFVAIVFGHIDLLKGWTFYEVMFIFGISMSARALEHIFFDNLWTIGMDYIRPGNFDRLMIRPINPLFHIIADRVQQDGLGSLIIGVIVLFTAGRHLDIDWGLTYFLLLLVMIVSGAMIFMAVNLFFATFSFWMVDSLPVMTAVHGLNEFARYPMTIYGKGIRFVLTWIIPYGFTAYYPATLFIEHSEFRAVALWSPVVAVVSCCIAYLFWKRGLRAFTSTGT